MRVLRQVAATVCWLVLWATIPAALLYPVTRWILNHTHLSEHILIQGYIIGIGMLLLPTGFLVDFPYREFVLKKPLNQSEPSN